MAKKTRRSSSNKKPKNRTPLWRKPFGWIKKLLPYAILLGCIGGVVIAVYAIFLDGAVREKFEGVRWTLPAKVYAEPISLYVGQDLSQEELIERLDQLGYQTSNTVKSTGTYQKQGDQLAVNVRGFAFWDGERGPRKILVGFDSYGIAKLVDYDDHKDISLLRLDPALIGSIYPTHGDGEDRILVRLEEVPDLLTAGLIAVEDRKFMHHWGVSPSSILRAVITDLRAGRVVQGGSTLTQQLIKNFYLSRDQTLTRKAKEAIMAVLLELHYSKAAIMEAYLNEVYLGQDGGRAIHGFGLASYFYFHKPLAELRPREIALLVAMVKGPTYYNPRSNPERALARRNLVLDMFYDKGLIDKAAWQRAKASDLGVGTKRSSATARYPGFIKLVERQLLEQYNEQELTEEGLRIFTTLDQAVQDTAQEKLSKRLASLENSRGLDEGTLQGAAVITSIEGGKVLGLISGRRSGYAGYNRALAARRQVGSTIKPFVYLTALQQPEKYNALTPLDDSKIEVELRNGDTWTPRNFSRTYHGEGVPLYYALSKSFNVATVWLSQQVGIPKVIDTLQAAGYNQQPLDVPSLALGAISMSPYQVAQIYNTVAGGGYYTPLTAIKAVTTSQGDSLTRHELEIKQVFDSQSNYILTWIMNHLTKSGTGASLQWLLPDSMEVAGKTGTTDGGRDGWFSGFSDNRVVVVWVGNDTNEALDITGASTALPVWADIMRSTDARSLLLVPPSGIKELDIHMVYNPNEEQQDPDRLKSCRNTTPVPFVEAHLPEGLDDCDSDIMFRADDEDEFDDTEGNWFKKLFE